MKGLLLSATLLALVHVPAGATNVSLDAELLKNAFGAAMPVSGLVVFTAGTSGNFFGPTPTSFVGGDEIVLKKWDLSAFGTAGVLSDTTGDLTFSGAWGTGDPLRMYWYPTLTRESEAPGDGTQYGTYRDGPGSLDGSAPWVTPGESDTITLRFYTADATVLKIGGGSNSAEAGRANLTVVPEPGTPTLIVLALFAAVGISRRRKRVTAC